jgi:RNA polymerase sigma-70 factor, ECF subfamily
VTTAIAPTTTATIDRDSVGRRATEADADAAARAAVELAYTAHAARLMSMLLGITRNPQVAEDLAQEAFVRLLVETRAGRAPDNTGGWLYRTSSNLAVSWARRSRVARRFAPLLVEREPRPSPEHEAIRDEQTSQLRAALRELSPAERSALLWAAEGLSGGEIADRLGKSPVAVRSMLCRARGQLRIRLMADGLRTAA